MKENDLYLILFREMLNITACNLKKMGWDDTVIAKMSEKKETLEFNILQLPEKQFLFIM